MLGGVDIRAIRTPGLGDTSYLVAHGGVGVVVDPQRDLRRFLQAVEETGVRVTHVLETHVHNDYVSGGPDLARRLGADLVMPAGCGAAYPFVPAFHTEELASDAGLVITPLHTPGHTPEHTSYLVSVEGQPQAVFSGGSLLAGSAGRTDLLGEDLARQLARLQHGSVRRLAALPGHVRLCPTHGAGSFCTSGAAGRSVSTIGEELAANPVLRYPDPESFADAVLSGLLPYPDYYRHMAPINRRGPAGWEEKEPVELRSEEAAELVEQGATVVDARSRQAYAQAHVPAAINVEPGNSFASWVGWLAPFDPPLLLVVEPGQAAAGLVTELARIGMPVAGVLRGMSEWEAGRPVSRHRLADLADLEQALDGQATVVDVRDPAEWAAGHLAGSVHCYVPDLREGLPAASGEEVWLVCASGFRSSIAAGLVERSGGRPVVVASGGVGDLLARRPDLAA